MENILTFIIPLKDEYENIKILLEKLKNKVSNSYSVILVYDKENEIILKLKNEISDTNTIFLKNKYNKGFSNAIKTGIENVNTEFFIVTMADNSDEISQCDSMLKNATDNDLDIVAPSRYIKDGKYYGGIFLKKLISKLAGLSLFYLKKSPIVDITNNFKLYRSKKVKEIKIESSMSFDIAMELTVKVLVNGGKISEIPTSWYERKIGKSSFNFTRHIIPYLRWYFLALINRN